MSNILRLNKLENQEIFPQTRIFDLGEQLCESMLEFESVWEEKDLEPECDIQDNVLVEGFHLHGPAGRGEKCLKDI